MDNPKVAGEAELSTTFAALQLNPATADATATTLETLPLEILHLVAGFLNAQGLKDIRLCSRLLARNIRPLLCRNINVTETTASFQRMISLCSQGTEIANGVKSLTYIPFTIEPMRRDWWFTDTPETWDELDRGDISFHEYSDLLNERATMAKNVSNVRYFIQALRLTNPHTITINFPNDNGGGSSPSFQYEVFPSHAHFIDLYDKLPRERGMWFACPVYVQSRGIATRSFMAILLALARSEHSVQVLEATTSLTFLLSPHIDNFCHAVKHLKKLHLTLVYNKNERHEARLKITHDWDRGTNLSTHRIVPISSVAYNKADLSKWTLGKFLSHAKGLEDLTVITRYYPSWSGDRFRDDIRQLPLLGLELPNLRFLSLKNLRCTGDSLLLLFSQRKKLVHVELEDMFIVDSEDDWLLWPRFFSNLRNQIRDGRNSLTSIEFYGWFDRVSTEDEEWDDDDRGWINHMGSRDSDSDEDRGWRKDRTCIGLGANMKDFVLGKNQACVWIPVPRDHFPFNTTFRLKCIVDDNFPRLRELPSDILSIYTKWDWTPAEVINGYEACPFVSAAGKWEIYWVKVGELWPEPE